MVWNSVLIKFGLEPDHCGTLTGLVSWILYLPVGFDEFSVIWFLFKAQYLKATVLVSLFFHAKIRENVGRFISILRN